jgi:predicted CXXCH cytochrome family protein
MHRMTRGAAAVDVRAPFDGHSWRFKDDVAVLERRGDDRFVAIEHSGAPTTRYRVTRVIGGRTREDFAGVLAEGDGRYAAEEVVLPVSYVFGTSSLRYKGYSVMVHERTALRAGPVWSRACIFCHNTVPEVDRMLGALAGYSSHRYQGEDVNEWLAPSRRARLAVRDDAAFSRVVADEVQLLGGAASAAGSDARTVARHAIDVVRAGFDGATLVEQGIGCEACHGGARDHAKNPGVLPSLAPAAPWLDVRVPGDAHAANVNRACARCHQVLFSRYPFTWEGGRRSAGPGGSHISSGEARDFLLGGCATAMPCTNCHDPHGRDDARQVAALATPAGNARCAGCHAAESDPARVRAHTHHDPAGPGGSCVACHMPRKNMGLDGRLTRYHRIGSPTDAARVLGDRPLECALCHVDRSVASLVTAMEQWWPVRYPRQRLEELYGSLDANVVRATLARGKPHEQAVAIALLGEARARDAAPLVAKQLLNEYPLVREWALGALRSIEGRCDVDLAADDSTIAREAVACGATDVVGPDGVRASTSTDEEPED